jgi:hypothetical protein
MEKTRDRLAGVTIAVLLQMGFVIIFIYSLPLITPAKRISREITFLLPRLREAAKPALNTRSGKPSPSPPLATQPLTVPPIFLPPVITPPATDLQTFGNALFGCAPENLSKLTPEQRSHCGLLAAIPRDKDTVREPPSLVKDLPRRQAELAARNTPARVPCITLKTQTLGFTGHQDTGVGVDPLCLLNGLINGFGGLPP